MLSEKSPFNVPKVSLGFFPTPLHRLDRLSDYLGCDLFMKRDDFTGRNLFGGNKVRKLEYLMGDAMRKGCDTVVTFGATQSNHAMETIMAARICGLTPIVYLVGLVEPDPDDLRANLLLDKIFGAEVHVIPAQGESLSRANERSIELAKRRMAELERQGHRCYDIPIGGANDVGSSAYIEGYLELRKQMEELGKKMAYLFVSTGSGGTLAGLVAGKALRGDTVEIVGVQAGPKDDTYKKFIAAEANAALRYIGAHGVSVSEADVVCDEDHYGADYEIPSPGANAAIRLLAEKEGILTDTVYTGKALYGMLQYISEKRVPAGSTVVFLHTGGTTALFAEKEIVGDFGTSE